jgi:hypothetical protein
MNLPYDLNLAIGYACVLTVLCYVAFWILPLALRAIGVAIRELVRSARSRLSRGGPPGGALTQQREHDAWWGPQRSSY